MVMKSQKLHVLAMLLIGAFLPSAIDGAEITNFTGGDPGEGLDFEGNFVYAVNISGPGGQVIGDADFTEDDADGFLIETTHNLPDWATPDYGDTDADLDLADIMRSIRWSNVVEDPPVVLIEMDVEVGQSYKMQMLFTESCCDRGFDIALDGELLVDDFVIYEHHLDDIWNINSRNDGVLITHEFTATDNPTMLELGMDAPDFPDNNGHISALTLELMAPGVLGDFDNDGQLTANDIDLLSEQVRLGQNPAAYDLTNDSLVNQEDRERWVTGKDVKNTWFGDSNLDGEFSSTDLVQVFAGGKYETEQAAGWADGDWDGDALFNSSDLVAAFADGGYENGPQVDAPAVPEPSSLFLGLLGMLFLMAKRVHVPCK